ncbi:MAG: phage head morphogenesis protein [Planctomycetaceae bacterium]|jgi:hypothetical protein|nr:phage head morphogenesis protein [Planctomycetaceae bacterium]
MLEKRSNEVVAVAEYKTAGDDRVCRKCKEYEGKRIKLYVARGIIPMHPNCRCAWVTPEIASYLSVKEQKKRSNETVDQTTQRLNTTVREEDNVIKSIKKQIDEREVAVTKESKKSGVDAAVIRGNDSIYKQLRKSLEDEQFKKLKAEVFAADHRDTIVMGFASHVQREAKTVGETLEHYKETLKNLSPNSARHEQIKKHLEKTGKLYREITVQVPILEQKIQTVAANRKTFRAFLESGEFKKHNTDKHPIVRDYIAAINVVDSLGDDIQLLINDIQNAGYVLQYGTDKRPDAQILTRDELDNKLAKRFLKKTPKRKFESVKAYSTIEACPSIIAPDREIKKASEVSALLKAAKEKTLTDEQKQILDKYNKTWTNPKTGKQHTITGEQALNHLATLQEIAIPTDIPLLLRRRVSSFDFFKNYRVGQLETWQGITSTYGTADAFNNPEHIKRFGDCIFEIYVPVGAYIIPIGKYGTSWHSLDEIALPARTRVKILEFTQSTKPPKMVVEVIVKQPVKYRE